MKKALLFLVILLSLLIAFKFFTSSSQPSDIDSPKSESIQPQAPAAPQKKSPGPTSATQEKSAFEKKTDEVLESLPTTSSISNKSEAEIHHAPSELMEAAKPLGEIVDAMKQDRKVIPAGKRFFRECALKKEVLEQVRAVCLRDLQDWANATGETLSLDEFPSEIIRLSQFLSPTKY